MKNHRTVIAKRAGRDAKTGETFPAGTPMIFTEAGWCIAPVAISSCRGVADSVTPGRKQRAAIKRGEGYVSPVVSKQTKETERLTMTNTLIINAADTAALDAAGQITENLDVTPNEADLIGFLRGEPLALPPFASGRERINAQKDGATAPQLDAERDAYLMTRGAICERLRAFVCEVDKAAAQI